jgi:hypothetical protein
MPTRQMPQRWRRSVVWEQWRGAASAFAAVCAVLCALGPVSPAGLCQTYTTTFAGTENPLSEGGRWSNNGLDWTNIRKGNGLAYSTQSGIEAGKFKFRDSYAVLSGFPPDQEAWGEVHISKPSSTYYQELEILLRFTSSPHNTTVYECFARCIDDSSSYVEIVRWDGPVGKFTYLARKHGKGYGLKNGDTLKASIIGNVITVSINGVQKAEAIDNTFKTGNPGIGEYLACVHGQGVGTNTDFGFASFTARGTGESTRGASASGGPRKYETGTSQGLRHPISAGSASASRPKEGRWYVIPGSGSPACGRISYRSPRSVPVSSEYGPNPTSTLVANSIFLPALQL